MSTLTIPNYGGSFTVANLTLSFTASISVDSALPST